MKNPDPLKIFEELGRPTDIGETTGECFQVCPFLREEFLIGKSRDETPVFIFELDDPGPGRGRPADLENIRLRHNQGVTLKLEGDPKPATVSVIECTSEDRALHQLFLSAIGNVLPNEPGKFGIADIDGLVEHLLELFKTSKEPTKGQILGLWAELLVIDLAGDCQLRALKAWHQKPHHRIDFSTKTERLEVKATTDAYRRHSFSFEQLSPPTGILGAVASVVTQELAGGVTVWTLWQKAIEAATGDNELRGKIDRLCVQALGGGGAAMRAARENGFDDSEALQKLKIVHAEDVPRITEVPDGVGRVRFESDLEDSKTILSDDPRLSDDGLISTLPLE